MGEMTQLRIPKSLVERLKKRARPHQALAGVIEELLNEIDSKRTLNDYPVPPRITDK